MTSRTASWTALGVFMSAVFIGSFNQGPLLRALERRTKVRAGVVDLEPLNTQWWNRAHRFSPRTYASFLAGDPDERFIEQAFGERDRYGRWSAERGRVHHADARGGAPPPMSGSHLVLGLKYLDLEQPEEGRRWMELALKQAPLVIEVPVQLDAKRRFDLQKRERFAAYFARPLESGKVPGEEAHKFIRSRLAGPPIPGELVDFQFSTERFLQSLDPSATVDLELTRYRTSMGRSAAWQPYNYYGAPIDDDGVVRVPAHSGVHRVVVQGVDMDPRELAWDTIPLNRVLLSHEVCRAPSLWVWPHWLPSPEFQRTAAQAPILLGERHGYDEVRPASAERASEIAKISGVARAQGDGSWRVSGTDSEAMRSSLEAPSPTYLASVDHAAVDLHVLAPTRRPLLWPSINVLDSRTKLPLTEVNPGCAYWVEPDSNRLRLASLFEALPDAIDIVFEDQGESVAPIPWPVAVGSRAEDPADRSRWALELVEIHDGVFETWSSDAGYGGSRRGDLGKSQIWYRIRGGHPDGLRLQVVDTLGRVADVDWMVHGSTVSHDTSEASMELPLPVEDIRRLQILPQSMRRLQRAYFDTVPLPPLDRELVRERIELEWPLNGDGSPTEFTALAPLRVAFTLKTGWDVETSFLVKGGQGRFRSQSSDLVSGWEWDALIAGRRPLGGWGIPLRTEAPDIRTRLEQRAFAHVVHYGLIANMQPRWAPPYVWENTPHPSGGREYIHDTRPYPPYPSSVRDPHITSFSHTVFQEWETLNGLALLGPRSHFPSVRLTYLPHDYYGSVAAEKLFSYLDGTAE